MENRKKRVCPVEMAGSLDNRLRRWVQNPKKILGPYIKEGMTVLDLGCGPGFFSLEMALLVGKSGRVIATDLQKGMLQKVKNKIEGTELEERITLHQCEADKIGLSNSIDFVLAFYMLHEVSNQEALFKEIGSNLKPTGQMLIVEPPFHVSTSVFQKMIEKAQNAGFTLSERPKVLMSKSAVLKKS
ncbi:MAG: class I SAM-dependent methyltransferase [Deltaproteobacteria bacterium]|nr:class I SAM-dependent methyltransferase [Deltaproteobacteria bacterium]